MRKRVGVDVPEKAGYYGVTAAGWRSTHLVEFNGTEWDIPTSFELFRDPKSGVMPPLYWEEISY